jgi:serine/threonine-protein kinase
MCFEMLTGKLPFPMTNQAALMFAHLQHPAPDPREIKSDLSGKVAQAILRALEKDPDRRQQSAGEFAAELAS